MTRLPSSKRADGDPVLARGEIVEAAGTAVPRPSPARKPRRSQSSIEESASVCFTDGARGRRSAMLEFIRAFPTSAPPRSTRPAAAMSAHSAGTRNTSSVVQDDGHAANDLRVATRRRALSTTSTGRATRGVQLGAGTISPFACAYRRDALRKRNLKLLPRSCGVIEVRHGHAW